MAEFIQDPRDGRKGPGAVSHGSVEKEYSFEAALYVDKRLGDHGIGSHCSRSKDVKLDENPRVEKVSEYKYCISHHFNAGGGTGGEFIHSIYADGKFEKMLKEEFEKADIL